MINLAIQYANGEKLYQQCVLPVCKAYNLTYMEFSIIMFLYNNIEYDTATQIINYRHLTKSHVSTSIKSLINKNLITTHFNNNDRKTIHLDLTSLTNDITKDGKIAQNQFYKLITAGFSKKEKDEFIKYMTRIDQNINNSLK